MNRSSSLKINKEIEALNETLGQVNLIGIFKAFYSKVAEYTFFLLAHGIFSPHVKTKQKQVSIILKH